MRILHFIYDHVKNPWVGGGAAVRVYEIYRRLKFKHYISVISGKYPRCKDYKEDSLEFKFIGNDRNFTISIVSYAYKAFKTLPKIYKNYDIIVEDFAPWNPIFGFRIKNKPVVLQLHHKEGFNILKKYFIFGSLPFLIEVFYPNRFKYHFVVSERVVSRFKIKSKNLENIYIIPNGVNIENSPEISSEENFIIFIGRINIHNKGLDILLEAMKNLDIKLLIVGKGADEEKLKKIILKNNLTNKVEFIGFVNQTRKVELLKKAKLVILPSRYEGQGICILEAASCGKAVVVSNIPELKYVEENNFGISYKLGNPKDLAEKIKFLLKNKEIRRKMGENARKFIENYTWDKVAKKYEESLVKIIQKEGKK